MLIKKKFKIAFKIIQLYLLKRKKPVFINWNITNRCNYHCKYCSIWMKITNELNTDTIISLINNFSECGTEAISFAGGEPLLRDDIGEIISHCRNKGIYTKITTNGSLIAKRISEIKSVNLIKISFNGPKHIHDLQRQEGSYEAVLEAVDLIKKYNINVGLNCVVSKDNLDYLDFVLTMAEKMKTKVSFQPLEHRQYSNEHIDLDFPEPQRFKEALLKLIETKKRGNSYIANSVAGLMYLSCWPVVPKMKCWAGQFYYRVTSGGIFTACERLRDIDSVLLNSRTDIKKIISEMSFILCQKKCWRNTTVELNYLLSFNLASLLNLENVLCSR